VWFHARPGPCAPRVGPLAQVLLFFSSNPFPPLPPVSRPMTAASRSPLSAEVRSSGATRPGCRGYPRRRAPVPHTRSEASRCEQLAHREAAEDASTAGREVRSAAGARSKGPGRTPRSCRSAGSPAPSWRREARAGRRSGFLASPRRSHRRAPEDPGCAARSQAPAEGPDQGAGDRGAGGPGAGTATPADVVCPYLSPSAITCSRAPTPFAAILASLRLRLLVPATARSVAAWATNTMSAPPGLALRSVRMPVPCP